jgi:hypothetical protein
VIARAGQGLAPITSVQRSPLPAAQDGLVQGFVSGSPQLRWSVSDSFATGVLALS